MDTNSKNKLVISGIVVVAFLATGILVGLRGPAQNPIQEPEDKTGKEPIVIKSAEIQEDNFSGSMPVISGSGELAEEARSYVADTVYDFKIRANEEVPELRAKFGTDTPISEYSLDMEATHLKGERTESIVLSVYAYTGGASGNSHYKVITSSRKNGEILNLQDVIREREQNNFTELAKRKLMELRPAGGTGLAVFPDAVNSLTFSSFSNWSMSEKNLNIYFAEYEVGPGALGAVVLPISLSEINGMLETAF